MLSSLVKEHQTKQAARKEKQGLYVFLLFCNLQSNIKYHYISVTSLLENCMLLIWIRNVFMNESGLHKFAGKKIKLTA